MSLIALLTGDAGALHPRGGVHGVAEDAELGQLGPDEPGHTRSSVDPDPHTARLPVVGHDDSLGAPDEGLLQEGKQSRFQ